jgi:hypothetical protein
MKLIQFRLRWIYQIPSPAEVELEHPMCSMGSPSTDLEAKDETPDLSEPKLFIQEAVFVTVICAEQLMTLAGLAFSITPLRITSASLNSTPRGLTWVSAASSLTAGNIYLYQVAWAMYMTTGCCS